MNRILARFFGATLLLCSSCAVLPGAGSPNQVPVPAVPREASVRLDWNQNLGTVTRRHFGLNLYAPANPANHGNARYTENVRYMNPGLVRLHNAGTLADSKTRWDGLYDVSAKTWDKEKIKRFLATLPPASESARLFNIPAWPKHMDANGDGFLDSDQFDSYAALCAELVRIVNRELKGEVRYWEITNERDSNYYVPFYADGGRGKLKDASRPDRWDEVADVYNRCAVAMKRVDSSILTGGPGAARPDLMEMNRRFFRKCSANIDFYTVHAYASGSASTPDADIYRRAVSMGSMVRDVVAMLKTDSPRREIPVMLGEFNISWTWETRDPRMTGAKGAVFDALVYLSAQAGGAYSAQAWNEKDGIYGKTDPSDARRPGAELLHNLNFFMTGTRVSANVSEPQIATVLAVKRGEERYMLAVNRTDSPCTLTLPTGAKAERKWQIADRPIATDRDVRLLPAHSVTVFRIR